MNCRIIIFCLILALVAPFAQATFVVVNSDDWIDVYSGLEFAYLNHYAAKFMTSKRYATLLPLMIPKGEHVIIIESQRVPFTINLAGSLRRSGYDVETIYSSGGRATNIELAKLVSTTKYVVIDPSYGYNAISVAAYAGASNSYVIFGDSKNADQILTFLKTREVTSLILYGQLDSRVAESLAVLSPEIINKGSRYKDNFEIMRKQQAVKPAVQLLLTDGSVIEEELMRAGQNSEATLLIGRDAVPEDVVAFVRQSGFGSAVLIGNHLSQSAKRLKDATGVPVFLKFGQGVTIGTESEPVKALDFFPLPVIDLNLVFQKMQYNTQTRNVEITYANKGMRAFVKTSIGILANGDRILTVGDVDVQRVESNETAGYQYPADLTEQVASGQNLTADMFTLYGESPDTLDRAITLTAPLPVITMTDNCELGLKTIQYNSKTQRFVVKVENNGPADCFADIELRDVIVNDQPTTITYPGTAAVKAGRTGTIEIKQRMTEVDLADNPEVNVHAQYGERQEFMLSIIEARMPLTEYKEAGISTTIMLTALIGLLLIVIVIMFFAMRRRGQKR